MQQNSLRNIPKRARSRRCNRNYKKRSTIQRRS